MKRYVLLRPLRIGGKVHPQGACVWLPAGVAEEWQHAGALRERQVPVLCDRQWPPGLEFKQERTPSLLTSTPACRW